MQQFSEKNLKINALKNYITNDFDIFNFDFNLF